MNKLQGCAGGEDATPLGLNGACVFTQGSDAGDKERRNPGLSYATPSGLALTLALTVVTCLTARGADVQFSFSDFTLAPQEVRTLYLFPVQLPSLGGNGTIITRDPYLGVSDLTGTLYISNVLAGTYRGEFRGRLVSSTNFFQFPTTNGLIYARDWLVAPINYPAGAVAWATTVADGRFVFKNNGAATNLSLFGTNDIWGELDLTNNPGTPGQALVSAGPGLAPYWGAAAGGGTFVTNAITTNSPAGMTNVVRSLETNQLQVDPWVSSDAFKGITNATPDYLGELGIIFLSGQSPYIVFGGSLAQGGWDLHSPVMPYGLNLGDATHMGTNGFEYSFINNGCWNAIDPQTQVNFADNVINLQNQNSKHYSAMRWKAAGQTGGDGSEKGAIGYGNTNAIAYGGMDYLEDYADGQGFYFVGGGTMRGGKLRGVAGDFAWFTNTLAAAIGNDTRANASFLIDGNTGGVTNKGSLQVGTTLTAINGDTVLGSAGKNISLLGANIVVGTGGTANTGNGSFGRLTLNTKGDICNATLNFPNFGMSQDSAGDLMIGWCSGTIGTNMFIDAILREAYFTNLITHFTTIAVSNGVAVGLYPASPLLTNIYYTNVTLNFPSTSAQSFSDLSVAIVNVKSNDIVTINAPAISQTNGIFSAWISNTFVFARFHNYASTAIDPASGIFNLRLEQYK